MHSGPPYPGGPCRLRCDRAARRRGPPGGCGSGIARMGLALRNSFSTISGEAQLSGPHPVKRCSHSESSLVNRSTSRGAGPSNDAATVSSRATSSATQRRPLGSVYLTANARLDWSMSSGVRSQLTQSKDWSREQPRAHGSSIGRAKSLPSNSGQFIRLRYSLRSELTRTTERSA